MADPPSAISREDEESLLSWISSLTLGLRTGVRHQVVNHASSIRSPATAPAIPTATQDQHPMVPVIVSFQTQPGPASQDAKDSQQPSIYHDASPAPISRPGPDGSVYLHLVGSVPTTIFDHAKPANINTIRGPFHPQRDIGSLSTPPSDHTALQSQVLNLRTQLAAVEALFRSSVDPFTSIIEEPSADDPCPDTISSEFVPTAYGLDDDHPPPLLDGGESVTSHASSVDAVPSAEAAGPSDVLWTNIDLRSPMKWQLSSGPLKLHLWEKTTPALARQGQRRANAAINKSASPAPFPKLMNEGCHLILPFNSPQVNAVT
jgi:hypothetical protein